MDVILKHPHHNFFQECHARHLKAITPEISAYLAACQNCRDMVEEFQRRFPGVVEPREG